MKGPLGARGLGLGLGVKIRLGRLLGRANPLTMSGRRKFLARVVATAKKLREVAAGRGAYLETYRWWGGVSTHARLPATPVILEGETRQARSTSSTEGTHYTMIILLTLDLARL